jgi:glycosyltransferase involved in cell wall biosynthesis
VKVAFANIGDARDVHSWSGTPYFMSRSLAQESEGVEYICPLRERWSLVFKGKQFIWNLLSRQRHPREREPVILKGYARQIEAQLARSDADVVFSTGTLPMAYLECPQPLAFWADATFAAMLGFYGAFTNLSPEAVRRGNAAEQLALERVALAIFSSDWAARSALENYRVDPAKVIVVPYGANMHAAPIPGDIRKLVAHRPADKCQLLFVGVDWWRKGGDIALEVARDLNATGLPTELTIVGCQPVVDGPVPPFVRALGFVSKSSPEGQQQLKQLFAETHFLILPSRADCSPSVLSEANAFGVPCLASAIGGIPTMVRDGVNGRLLAPDAGAAAYSRCVRESFDQYARYQELALSSLNEYHARLNWPVAAQSVMKLLARLKERRS